MLNAVTSFLFLIESEVMDLGMLMYLGTLEENPHSPESSRCNSKFNGLNVRSRVGACSFCSFPINATEDSSSLKDSHIYSRK